MTLKDKLLRIADGDENVPDWNYKQGLCSNIAHIMDIGADAVAKQMDFWAEDWEPRKTAQRTSYPVPFSHAELCHVRAMQPHWTYKSGPVAVYDYHSITGTLYNGSEYGARRRDLARHIAGKL